MHQACARDPQNRAAQGRAGVAALRTMSVASSSGAASRAALALPVTLVETSESEPDEIFDPFSAWLVPVDSRQLGYTWLATACRDPAFAEFFSGIAAFSDANAEVYTIEVPVAWHGQTWRTLRRALYGLPAGPEKSGGVVPLGVYRSADGSSGAGPGSERRASAHADLRTRLLINPAFDLVVAAGDLLVALCEDEAELRRIVRQLRL